MKKFLKILGIAALLLLVGLIILARSLSMKMPEGEPGDKADEVAEKMLSSLNYEGYRKLAELSWTFRNGNKYVWNKKERTVLVEFEEAIVMLDFANPPHEIIKSNDLGEEELIEKAIANFYNDSFWLVAPYKVFDKGVERRHVDTEDGPGLLVTYKSGGVTPGDSYLWVLDENYRPLYWRVYTSNVPIKGMKFKWKDWEQYQGVWLATSHPAQVPVNISIDDLKVK